MSLASNEPNEDHSTIRLPHEVYQEKAKIFLAQIEAIASSSYQDYELFQLQDVGIFKQCMDGWGGIKHLC